MSILRLILPFILKFVNSLLQVLISSLQFANVFLSFAKLKTNKRARINSVRPSNLSSSKKSTDKNKKNNNNNNNNNNDSNNNFISNSYKNIYINSNNKKN